MNSIDQQRIRAIWAQYALPRFSPNQSRVRWVKLRDDIYEAWQQLAAEAAAHGGRLRFDRNDLVELVIAALDQLCEYCGDFFGVDSWGVTRRNPLRKVHGSNIETTSFGIEAYAAGCGTCAQAHKYFSDAEFHAVLNALRLCDGGVTAAALEALAKGTSRTLGPASNAKRADSR